MLELNKLYNMDCMEGMKEFPDKYFDLAIVDPPYGIGIQKPLICNKNKTWEGARDTSNYDIKEWDKDRPGKNYFNDLQRVAKDVIIWGGNYFSDYLKPNNGWIVWDKKTTNPIFSPFEMAYTTFGKPGVFRYLYEGYKREREKDREVKIHPTQKPTPLYKWILYKYAAPNFKIIDTHAGSCSSVIAF